MKHELNAKPILTLCLVGSCVTRLVSILFSTYLLLWVQTFDGFDNDSTSKNIYANIMIVSVICSCLIFYPLGRLIDEKDPIRLIPWAFALRCVSMYMFNTLT